MTLGHCWRLTGRLLALVALFGAILVGAGTAARADSSLIPTTLAVGLTGTTMTVTLTAADGSVPVGVPIGMIFSNDGFSTDVGVGPVTDANGQYILNDGYPDYGTMYTFYTPGDEVFAPATSNAVHISAPVTTSVGVLSNIDGATVSGQVTSLHGYAKPGMTVELYAVTRADATLVGTETTDTAGGWTVPLPTLVTPTSYHAVVLADAEDTGSDKTVGTVAVPTRTTIAVADSGGTVKVHGAVVNGLGTGLAGVPVQIDAGSSGSAVRTLRTVTTNIKGQYIYAGRACTTVCFYEAVALGNADRDESWLVGNTMKAPTNLALSVRRGATDRIRVSLTHAADGSAIANQKVAIYYRYAGRKTWIKQLVVTADQLGRAVVSEHRGRARHLQARFEGNSALSGSASKTAYLKR
jgi:hypothetical protein